MRRKINLRAVGASLFGVVGACAALGCGSSDSPGCGELEAELGALNASLSAVQSSAEQLRGEVAVACAGIAGEPAPADPNRVTDQQMRELCASAVTVIEANLNGSVDIQVVVVPPACQVNVEAQIGCEARCEAEANLQCEGGDVTVRCDPGDLSVVCEGSCALGATCQGSATVAVECSAQCEGRCEGTCNGTCNGTAMNGGANAACDGTCEGECTGQCYGSCEVTAEGGIECGVDARCKGGCSVAGSAPRCEATLKPPECQGEANVDCSGSCEAAGTVDAQCTEPSVDVIVDAESEFATNLKAQLPVILKAAQRGALAGESVLQLTRDASAAGTAAGGCGLGIVLDFLGTLDAALAATTSVTASFEASIAVSASVSASAN